MIRRLRPPLLTLLLTLGLSGCSALDYFTSSDNEEPPADLVEFTPKAKVETLWSADLGAGASDQDVKLVPTIYQGRLFAADRAGEVKALDAVSGDLVWRADTDLAISAGPGVGAGLVVVGASDAEVVALDEESGEQKWRTPVSSEVLSVPQVSEEAIVVVQTIDAKVVGLDLETGERRWTYQRSVPLLTLRGSSSPVVDGALVICGFASGKLVALDLIKGDPLWEISVATPKGRSELERMVDLDGDPKLRDGVIYAVSFHGALVAVAEDTGVLLWRRDLSSYKGVDADWRYVYVTDDKGWVWAFDPRNGSAVWRQQKLQGRRLTGPVVFGDTVVVGDFEGYLHWLDAEDGSMVARSRVGSDPISVHPRVEGETLYVYDDGGDLAALTLTALESEPELEPKYEPEPEPEPEPE